MDKKQAQNIIKSTFEGYFDRSKFTLFVNNLFNYVDSSKAFPRMLAGSYIKESFRDCIKSYDRLGRFTDDNSKKIDILTVCLHRKSSLEHARAKQRNFIAGYLKGDYGGASTKDAALVAFYHGDSPDWRFSLVTMDHVFDKQKAKQQFSAAKRHSFLVGANENSHTAQSQLVPILADVDQNPTLAKLQEAFNIEKVTSEFFKRYRTLYLDLWQQVSQIVKEDQSHKIRKEFEQRGIDKEVFSKKLLGQIVFLYFLQKKGWLGAKEKWGDGDKKFLRNLFTECKQKDRNFFDDYLEYLFYDALNNEHRGGVDPSIHPRFNCKIPFLNGGLFEPINNYDWQNTDLLLPNELFSNKKDGSDEGSGILDLFDLFNFTVKEDEPLEKEVAVDPEMLGKVFENLLEVKDRKSKGTYYTPREIVHYMCQQSLTSYLDTQLNGKPAAHERIGDQELDMLGNAPKRGQLDLTVEHKPESLIPKEHIEQLILCGEQVVENEATVEAKGRETGTYSYRLRETIRRNAALIDEKLADIRVCDAAIGSGAFLVGIMTEIVKARNVLSVFNKDASRTTYNFKRECIERSLYGVDIDPGAVEIAKLRLWLSLVVDEEDIKQIKPLPNLDYKVVVGNSLLGFRFKSQKITEIEHLKEQFFDETGHDRKAELKSRIDQQLSEALAASKKSLGYEVDFDFETHFSEVVRKRGGFDITIGNPPYVRADEKSDRHRKLRKQILASGTYDTLWEKWDLFVPFIEKSYKILKPGGVTSLIVSDAFCHSKYAQKPQQWFLKNARVLRLDFCSKLEIFEAAVHNLIYFFQKGDGQHNRPERRLHAGSFGNVTQLPTDEQQHLTYRAFFPEDANAPQFNVATVALGNVCYISYGLRPSSKEHEAKGKFITADLVSEKKDKIHCKPYVEGKHLGKWLVVTNLWLEWGTKRAPGQFCRPTFPEMYDVPAKIIAQRSPGPDPVASLDEQQLVFTPASVGFIPWYSLHGVQNNSLKKSARYADEIPPRPDLPRRRELEEISQRFAVKYLLAVMNSSVVRHCLRANRRSNIHLYPDDWKKLPIPDVDSVAQAPIVALVDRILSAKRRDPEADTRATERETDRLVYKLYGLTPEQIAIVEQETGAANS